MTSEHPPRIAVDFDGVIHDLSQPWTGPLDVNGEPIPGAFDWLADLLDSGWVVVLHTCRLMHSVPEEDTWVPEVDLGQRQRSILAWFLHRRGGHIVSHPNWRWWTHGGKPWADVYVDDKGYRFTGTFPTPDQLAALAGRSMGDEA